MNRKLKVVQYLNQFFGQEGKEDKADMGFLIKKGPIGPGVALQGILGERGEVVATVVCGDNYFVENLNNTPEEGLKLVMPFGPDLFFAGPAFEAGRYGISCGAICKIVQERLGIPAITGMYAENPGVGLYRKDVYICKTQTSAAKMLESLKHMVDLGFRLISKEKGCKLVSGENVPAPSENNYFPRGVVKNEYSPKTAAERGVDMLLSKIRGKPFQTETELPTYQPIKPPAPISDLSSCEIALISDGGLTPKGNPDSFSSRNNTVWAGYEIESLFKEGHSSADYEVVHLGYNPSHVLENANRLVPVDAMRDLEKQGVIKKLHRVFYSTSGNATSYEHCNKIGEGILEELRKNQVDGAILTSA